MKKDDKYKKELHVKMSDKKEKKVKIENKTKTKKFICRGNLANKKGTKIYFSYTSRLGIVGVLLLLSFTTFLLFSFTAFSFDEKKVIDYQGNSNLDYKVYLKENDFYEMPYLGKNKVYVASLIDYINVFFNYQFHINDTIPISFKYDVVAKLEIKDEALENIYYEKEYNLLTNEAMLDQNNSYSFNKDVKIDYAYYNNLANKFKNSYGVDTVSSLIVSLKVHKDAKEGDILLSDEVATLSIPLSEKSVNIKLVTNDVNETNNFTITPKLSLTNIKNLIISIIFLIISIFLTIKLIHYISLLNSKKSPYDKFINKVLKEYDRLIVISRTMPPLAEFRIIEIDSFQELLDVRDNLKMPIMYYNVTSHQKCYFYIRYEDSIYLLKIKAVDMQDEENEK